jgi:hypothetical protein
MTATATDPTEPPREAQAAGGRTRIHPSDILIHLIVTLMVPMFLEAAGGELHFARMAALETVTSYRARTQADLIAIAQIVAFGFAALASLSVSLVDDVPLAMALRLRSIANGLNRSAEHNRRALARSQADPTLPNILAMADLAAPDFAAPDLAADPIDPAYEAAVLASVAEAQQMLAEAEASLGTSEPAPVPAVAETQAASPTAASPITAPAPSPAPIPAPILVLPARTQLPARVDAAMTERQIQAAWAAAATRVADECTAGIPHLPPPERKPASHRAIALSTCATDLLASHVPPPPRLGDRGAIMRSRAG